MYDFYEKVESFSFTDYKYSSKCIISPDFIIIEKIMVHNFY